VVNIPSGLKSHPTPPQETMSQDCKYNITREISIKVLNV
jgi:hypothetical protein